MTHRPQPNLLVVQGLRAHRYVAGRRVEAADMDESLTRPEKIAHLEEFRKNGLPPETADAAESSDAVIVRDPGVGAMARIASDLYGRGGYEFVEELTDQVTP
jgi:hypothetical protein